MGVQRKSMILSDEEKKVTVSWGRTCRCGSFTPGADPVHKVTIIPRGRALGVTTVPLDENMVIQKDILPVGLPWWWVGRAAEELIFNEITTGASNDIERATTL